MRTPRLITAVLCALATACAESPSIDPGLDQDRLDGEPVVVTRLQEPIPAHYSGFGEPARLVVGSRAEWEAVWRRLWRSYEPLPPLPGVDFEREVVLVAAMGGRGTGGYSIRVHDAAAQPGQVVVRVVETSPGRACVVTQALTAPVDVVKLPRTTLPVQFETVKVVHNC